MIKTTLVRFVRTHLLCPARLQYHIVGLLILLILMRGVLLTPASAQSSRIDQNCMGTGGLSPQLISFLNTRFQSSWTNQKRCQGDLSVSFVSTGDLLSGNMMQYNITVSNPGARWSYGARVTITMTNGLMTTTPIIQYNNLAPGQSQTIPVWVYKTVATATTPTSSTVTMTVSDSTIADINSSNNTATHTMTVRGSSRAVCRHHSLTVPVQECETAMDLYDSANGAGRRVNTNRGSSPNMESWFGLRTTQNDDLLAHYTFDANDARDDSGNGRSGTFISSPTFGTGRFNNAVSLNGASAINIGSSINSQIATSTGFTINMWVNTASSNQTFMSIIDGASSNFVILRHDSSLGDFRVRANGVDTVTLSFNSPISDGRWKMLTATYIPGGQARLYIDGILSNSTNVSSSLFNLGSIIGNIGRDGRGWGGVNGQIDEVRIYNRALSASEVQQLYTSNTTREHIQRMCFGHTNEQFVCNMAWDTGGTTGNNMVGALPSSIGTLSELTTLNFNRNLINGSLPASLGNLKKLTHLIFDDTSDLTGQIPTELGGATELSWLTLWGNNLSGPIPASLANTKITYLGLDSNQFTSLPDLSALNLSQLSVSNNLLSGALPAWIGSESNMTHLSLNNNQFSGPIPASWSGLTRIAFLRMQNNLLTGSLDVFSGMSMTGLNTFRFTNNRLDRDHTNSAFLPSNVQARVGSAAIDVTNQTDITPPIISSTSTISATISGSFLFNLNVTENSSTTGAGFTGGLPVFFTGSTFCRDNLITTGIIINRIGSTTLSVSALDLGSYVGCQIGIRDRANLVSNLIALPTFLNNDYGVCNTITDVPQAECRALMDLFVSTRGTSWTTRTNWRGVGDTTPTTLCDWHGVRCQSGRVSGLFLAGNENPTNSCWFSNTSSSGVFLPGNNLSGSIPSTINTLTGLTALCAPNNSIGGVLPSFSGMQSLGILSLFNNRLTGSLTTQLDGLMGLRWLALYNNQLSGPLPSSWGLFTGILGVGLNNNQLSGPLPSSWGGMSGIQHVHLGYNQLSGPLPSSWSHMRIINQLFLEHNQFSGPLPEAWGAMRPSQVRLFNNNIQGLVPQSWADGWTGVASVSIANNCLSPSTSYLSPSLQSWLTTKSAGYTTQKNCPGVIAGKVWDDLNDSGQYDHLESIVPGTTVVLRACTDQTPVNTGGKLLNHQLIAHYTFDMGDARDDGSFGINGSPINTTFGAGMIGGGANIASNGYISHPTTGMSTTHGTIAVWIRPTADRYGIWQLYDQSIANTVDWIGIFSWSASTLFFRIGNGVSAAANDLAINSSGNVPLNQWTHLAFTWSGTADGVANDRMIIYVNGTQVSTRANANFQSILNPMARLGQAHGFGASGTMDDFRAYGRALSATEVQQIYQITAPQAAQNIPISYSGIVVASTVSTNSGYVFSNIAPGRYYLEYSSVPDGYRFATQNWGGYHNSANSDTNPWSAKTSCFEVYNGLNETSVDVGLKYLQYSSCEATTPEYSPVLVGQPVTINIAGYGQNAGISIRHSTQVTPELIQDLTNQGNNWTLKNWNTTFIPTRAVGNYIISGAVDGSSDRLEYYGSVTSAQAYRVVADGQRCAVSQSNLGPQATNLNSINQIATLPTPLSYCTAQQNTTLPFAAVTNQPPRAIIAVPACTTTLVATADASTLCNFITDATPAECRELVRLYDATEGWTYCTDQYAFCSFSGTRRVRYGTGGAYRYLTGTNGVSCNVSTFGSDPALGVGKGCRYEIDGGTWINESRWRFVNDPTPRTICDWHGVTCAGGRVTQINLSGNNLQRTLSGVVWSQFAAVSVLDLSNNKIGGTLPAIESMSMLQTLRLSNNIFTGMLPVGWSNAPVLQHLVMDNAGEFTGSIPAWTGLSDTLTIMNLGSIMTTGQQMPGWMSQMTGLQELYLYDNQFQGLLSGGFMTLTGLRTLQIQNNNLHGNLAHLTLPRLTSLYTSSHPGAKSALDNNCLYTGAVSGSTGAFLDARFVFGSNPLTNWRNQRLCPGDLELTTIAKVGNLTTGLVMTYIVDYRNLGSLPSYEPRLTISLHSGLLLMSGTTTIDTSLIPHVVVLPPLNPGQTGQFSFMINKMGLGSGTVPIVNQFVINDVTISDINTFNNSFIDNDMARGSAYPVCVHPLLTVSTMECEALGDLYTFTSGSGWTTRINWMTSPDIESWHGITLVNLTGVNYVQRICMATATDTTSCSNGGDEQGNNLSGELQASIGNLPYLFTLNLNGNINLAGAIPFEVSLLDNIDELRLFRTNITNMGTGIAGMNNLKNFHISGAPSIIVSPNLGQSPSLERLTIMRYSLTSLPDLSGLGDTLVHLNLHNNRLTSVPVWLSTGFVKLTHIDISFNNLSGSVGTIFDNMPSLSTLYLGWNSLNGLLPGLSNSTKINQILLQNNRFSGGLPTSWSLLTGISRIELPNNTGLSGPLPASWSGMRSLQILNLSGLSLQGTIPTGWFAAMTGMREFVVGGVGLDGPVPVTSFQTWTQLRTNPITSTVANNCMYTGLVTTPQAQWMDTSWAWRPQLRCVTDLQLELVSKSAPDFNPGRRVTYTIRYRNNGTRWSYEPKIIVALNSGLALSGTFDTTGAIDLPMLTPGQTGEIAITVDKRGSGSGIVNYTNIFTISDTTTTDTLTGNNTITDTGLMRLFKYNECIEVTDISQVECEALMDLYTSTNGPNWINKTNWAGVGDATPQTACDWFGIYCTSGSVRQIWLNRDGTGNSSLGNWRSSNNVSGSLPQSIGDFGSLTHLDLHRSNFGGSTIPASIGNLSALQWMRCEVCNLSGSLPSTIGNLSNLSTIYLGSNSLSGPLPASLTGWINITYISLPANQFSGPLPLWLTGLSRLHTVFLHNNQFTGTIPNNWSLTPLLHTVRINGNQLTGPLPVSWGSWTGIRMIAAGNNQLTGTLPASWSSMRSLTELNIENNQIGGELPVSWGGLTGLQHFWGGNNQLTGTLPASWSGMRSIRTLQLNNNQLTGVLPESWSSLIGLNTLRLDYNNLHGELPSSWSSLTGLTTFRIRDNHLEGLIPTRLETSWLGLTSNSSMINNNCLFTGHISGSMLTYMNARFGSNWQSQKRCDADLILPSLTVTGNMNPGAFMTYTLDYRNDGPKRAYTPVVAASLHNGLEFVAGGSSTGISIGMLRPGSTGQVILPIRKVKVGSGTEVYTNKFTISDLSITDSPVAHWLLDGSPHASIGGLTGIASNVVATADRFGNVNGAYSFNGVNSRVTAGHSTSLNISNQLTLSAWVRPNTFGDWEGIITKGVNGGPYAMQIWSDGSLRFTANWNMTNGSGSNMSFNSNTKLTLGQRNHVSITYDGSLIRFYINGVQDSNIVNTNIIFGTNTEEVVIGADLPGGDEYFDGAIDDVVIYNRALSQSEIMTMYQSEQSNNILTDTGVMRLFKYPICGQISDISQVECEALGDLYTSTNGASWTNRSNWMGLGDPTPTTACDWFGVTCGNLMSPIDSAAVGVQSLAPGLFYQYWERNSSVAGFFGSSSFTVGTRPPDKTGITSNAQNTNYLEIIGSDVDTHVLSREGYIDIPASDTYTFYTLSDDNSRIFINDKVVIQDVGCCQERTGPPIYLTAGLHRYRVEHQEGGGGNYINVRWSSSTIPKQLIPDSVFYHNPSIVRQYVPKTTVVRLCLSHNNSSQACNYAGREAGGTPGNNLSGVLSDSLGDLTSLTRLTFAGNTNITGSIPASIGSLSYLDTLSLFDVRVVGTIPQTFGDLFSLRNLGMANTRLTGSLPSGLFMIPHLSMVHLYNAGLSGPLPSQGVSNLTQLHLFANRFTGPLPAWITTRNRSILNLNGNQLSGPLPTSWSSSNMTMLGLSDNQFTGILPTSWNFPRLNELSINNNTGLQTGAIPGWIANSTGLRIIDISRTNRIGSLPTGWSMMTGLQTLHLSDNGFTGEIPLSWGLLTGLTTARLANNNLDGPIPTRFPSSWIALGTNSSTINNNCMFTENISGSMLTYMNARFGSNWQAQKICESDPALVSLVVSGSLQTENTMIYTLTYRNNGPRWIYKPTISLTLSTGLAINNVTGTIVSTLGPLSPGSSGTVSFSINKRYLTTVGLSNYTNTFVISDGSVSDLSGGNNMLIHTGIVRGSQYPVCREPDLTVPLGECEALMDIYTTMNGPNWFNRLNWGVSPNIATWFGVQLSGGRVSHLHLTNSTNSTAPCPTIASGGNNLRGQLPTSIVNLNVLTSLCLGNNQLTGQIPSTIMLLPLTNLSLHSNRYTGFQSILTGMTVLHTLDLSSNLFSGSWTSQIGRLPGLRNLWIQTNQFNGSLTGFTQYPLLQSLKINHNIFTGLVPTTWSSLTGITELFINNNFLDRDHINHAIIPSTLTSWYNGRASRLANNQGDVTAPTISNISAISGTIVATGFGVTLSINENSFASGLYTAGPLSGQVHSGMYVDISGPASCSTISSSPIMVMSGIASFMLYPEIDGSYVSCQLRIRDRAHNLSNGLTMGSFIYEQPPYRLHIRPSGSGAVFTGGVIALVRDVSSFDHPISLNGGSPLYNTTEINQQPSLQFNAGQSLGMPGIFRRQQFNNMTIMAVVRPGSTPADLVLEQAGAAAPLLLRTNLWRLGNDTLSFSMPTTHHSLITATHAWSGAHTLRINGSTINSITSTQGLQVSGLSTTLIGSGLSQGLLSELIVYTKDLTGLSLNYLESYMALKYGITLPGSYTMLNASGQAVTIWSGVIGYQNQVIGLAQHLNSPLPIDTVVSTASTGSVIMLHRRGTWSNGQYMIAGASTGVLDWVRPLDGSLSGYNALGRNWLVRRHNNAPGMEVSITPNSIANFNFAPTWIVSNTPTFTTIVASGSMILSGTRWISSGLVINDGQYLSFAVGQSNMGGRVWLDYNRDGIQSPSEPSVSGAVVTLWRCPAPLGTVNGPWSLINGQTSPQGPLGSVVTTAASGFNYMFSQLDPGNYYMTYAWSGVQLTGADGSATLIPTKQTVNGSLMGIYPQAGSTWSDYEQYAGWFVSRSPWFGAMSSLSGVSVEAIDSDVIDPNDPGSSSFVQRASKCYTIAPGMTYQDVGLGLRVQNTTDLALTHTINTGSIPNVSGATVSLSLAAMSYGPVRSHYTQIVTKLPRSLRVVQVIDVATSQQLPYIMSGSDVKVYLGIFNANQTRNYRIDLQYDGSNDDADTLTIASSIASTTDDSVITNNTPTPLSVTLVRNGASVGDTIWIDDNMNGIQDSNELGQILNPRPFVTLHRANGSVAKTMRQSSLTGQYLFTSVEPGSYYISVTNLPRGYTFTDMNTFGATSLNDNNIDPLTNTSAIFTVTGMDAITIDIGLKKVSALTQCTGEPIARKLRLGHSYRNFGDIYLSSPLYGIRIFDVTRTWTEKADYNMSTILPAFATTDIYSWTIGSLIPGYIAPNNPPRQTVIPVGPDYTIVRRPAQRGSTGQIELSYQYLGCYINPAAPNFCMQYFRTNSCYTYEVTSCGDGVVDSFDQTYLTPSSGSVTWSEQCDFGAQNGTAFASGGIQCSRECTILTDKVADLGVSKTDRFISMCALPMGTDGIVGSMSFSGMIASPIVGSLAETIVVSN